MLDHAERKPTQKNLRNFSGRLLQAQENERKRIGRELHDDIAQRLGLLVLEFEEAKELVDDQMLGSIIASIECDITLRKY